jgi:hypothetical protein
MVAYFRTSADDCEGAAVCDQGGNLASGDALDQRINLLTIYATQFGSYTSLLWQVPALGLTAQSFLLMIALSSGHQGAVVLAASLSMVIAIASYTLMHQQRGFAISHAYFARQLATRITLVTELDRVTDNDAEPKLQDNAAPMKLPTRVHSRLAEAGLGGWHPVSAPASAGYATAATVWDVAHTIYHIWRACMFIFVLADIAIIISAVWHLSWF